MYQPKRPNVTLCNLWERRMTNGELYLSGRNGSNMYVVTRLPSTGMDGPTWALMVAETPATQQAPDNGTYAAAVAAAETER